MDRIERIATALRSLDLEAGVTIEGRTFLGPADAMTRLRELEGIAAALASSDLFSLYERKIAHDGIFDTDLNAQGRFFAYLCYELKGSTPEEVEELLSTALEDLVKEHGKDAVLKYIPPRVVGRQVTEGLTVRPEVEDFPSYYSKVRMAYAEKMALDELPKGVLSKIRAEQERILDAYGWTTVRIQESGGEVVEICGDAYALSPAGKEAAEPYRAIWAALVAEGPERYYDIDIATDGEYSADIDDAIGRYYAYVKASLKGQSGEDRKAALLAALPPAAVESLGAEAVHAIFRETIDGDQITASLTIRPEADEYASYFNPKKLQNGKERVKKQILINAQAEIIAAVERILGSPKKYIILD